MGRKETALKKVSLLHYMNEKKKVLFGNFSTLTHREKETAWRDVLTKAQSLGLAGGDRDWQFVRDKLFGVWKSRTLGKRDNAKRTGTGGGKDKILDEVDIAILEIISKESPVVDGLDVPESGMALINVEQPTFLDENSLFFPVEAPQELSFSYGTAADQEQRNQGEQQPIENKEKRKEKRKNNSSLFCENHSNKKNKEDNNDEAKCLKRELLKLEIENRKVDLEKTKIDIYVQSLNALKLERELGVKASEWTSSLLTN